MKPVIINADDYAMDAGVDEAILDLGRRGIVTATSAMVLSPGWPEAGLRLLDVEIDRGLHLDLTSPFAEAVFQTLSLPRLIGAAFLGQLGRGAVRQAITRQLQRFDAVVKAPPRFVDGHQHVHHLPLIRDELLSALNTRYGAPAARIGIRLCLSRSWRGLKASIIERTGARQLSPLAARGGHCVNTDFAGVYGFSPRADMAALWQGWLTNLTGEQPLVMCHVAAQMAGVNGGDPIRPARLQEWKWLGSSAFAELCSRLSITLARWRVQGRDNAY